MSIPAIALSGADVPISRLPELYVLLDLHYLEVIKVPSRALDHLSKRVDLALFDKPRLCPRDKLLWEPSREVAPLEDEAGGEKSAVGGLFAGDDVARDDMGCVWIRIAQEIR